jgi:hypothetical protein
MQKVYKSGIHTIVDVNGTLVPSEGWVEQVAPVVTQEQLDVIDAEKEKEELIQAKVRELAITELIKDGKLEKVGDVVSVKKATI